ncbi:MAG: hypothetical protein JSV89_05890 [Spirochaetaceae bacterium]|nr:MAG: hypothetical protein JSV89_05890 [Spirochaetaceae bacterium]
MKNNVHKAGLISAGRLLTVLVVLFAAAPLFSANVTVPSLEIFSWGRNDGSGIVLDSYGSMDLALDGGYKFGGAVTFDFTSSSLETAAFNDMLAFKSVSVTLRNLFNIPLDFTYFIGQGDTFGTGELFTTYFGTPLLGSRYTSYLHFPTATDYNFYEGIHTIYGTGGKFEFAPVEKNWLLSLYIYQDSAEAFLTGTPPNVIFSSRQVSLDVRTAFNFEKVRLEAFLGTTLPSPDSAIGYYRTGLFFHAGTDKVEFLAEIGIPRWRPLDDALDLDLFYLLVEQRVHLGRLSIVPTFFWRPGYYQQEANATGEEGMDINLDLQIHSKEESLVSGGVEGNFIYLTAPSTDQTASVIPYIQLSTPGVIYKAQVNTKVWPLDLSNLSDMLAVFLSIEAAF